MYFTSNKLHKYEKEMKIVPGFGTHEPWDGKRKCSDCRNNEFSIRACAKCDCPYLSRKMESYSSVTTRQLFDTFLCSIKYAPFHNRMMNILSHFKGNKLYNSENHLKMFRYACIMSKVSKRNYNMIAAMYVLTMYPDLWSEMVLARNGFFCQRGTRNKKEKVIIRFANDLFNGKPKINLYDVSDPKRFDEGEFICLCNALLILRFGAAAVKYKMTDTVPAPEMLRIDID